MVDDKEERRVLKKSQISVLMKAKVGLENLSKPSKDDELEPG